MYDEQAILRAFTVYAELTKNGVLEGNFLKTIQQVKTFED